MPSDPRVLSIGIMQGRLLPKISGRIQCFPADQWRDEFPLAEKAGLQLIEWIYEVYGAVHNPLSTDQGIAELKELSVKHGVAVRSLCADYFMDRPMLANPEEGVLKLHWLLGRCHLAGIKRIILPFVDASRLINSAAEDSLIEFLTPFSSEAESMGIELHLETDLPPVRFAKLIAQLPESVFKVNYDSGNSASHGYDVAEEFAAYGARIGSLHIKDRVRGGSTVPIGAGNANLPALRAALESIDYDDDVILQAAREREGNELEWIRGVRENVEKILFQNLEEKA
jgi:hexulose-6-phosphate isomerase